MIIDYIYINRNKNNEYTMFAENLTCVLTWISGIEAASSVKVFPSGLWCCFPVELPVVVADGKRNENFRLFGETGLIGAEGGLSVPIPNSFIDLAADSFAKAIAQSNVRSSAAEIGFT